VAVPVYEVKTRLSIAKGGDPSKAVPDDVREDRYFMGTQAEAISSPLIVRKALAAAPLTIPARHADDPMRFVLESLKVSPIVNTNVMAIRFNGSNAEETLGFVSALVKSYEEYIQATETNSGGAALELLAQRERELSDELKSVEQAYAELRKSSPLVGKSEDQIASTTEVLGEISRSLGEVRVRRCELQSRLAMVERVEAETAASGQTSEGQPDNVLTLVSHQQVGTGSEGTEPAAVRPVSAGARVQNVARLSDLSGTMRNGAAAGGEDLADIEKQLRAAQVAKDRVAQQYGELHPAYRRAESEIAKWRTLLQDRLTTTVDSMQHQFALDSSTEKSLSEVYEEELQKAKELDNYVVREEAMLAEIARIEKAHGAVFGQLTDAKLWEKALEQGRTSVSVQDLDGGDRRAELLWPMPIVFVAACALIGFALAVLFVFGLELFKQSAPQPALSA
jgi:uncharacterized protein involved in exopolysaccharide biosynthesis